MPILLLLRRIHAMCGRIDRQAVNALFDGKVFDFPKVLGILFLHDCDCAAGTCRVGSPVPGIELHNIRSPGYFELCDGFVCIKGKYNYVVSSAAEQEGSMVL